jgi:hypothetical protein
MPETQEAQGGQDKKVSDFTLPSWSVHFLSVLNISIIKGSYDFST